MKNSCLWSILSKLSVVMPKQNLDTVPMWLDLKPQQLSTRTLMNLLFTLPLSGQQNSGQVLWALWRITPSFLQDVLPTKLTMEYSHIWFKLEISRLTCPYLASKLVISVKNLVIVQLIMAGFNLTKYVYLALTC